MEVLSKLSPIREVEEANQSENSTDSEVYGGENYIPPNNLTLKDTKPDRHIPGPLCPSTGMTISTTKSNVN